MSRHNARITALQMLFQLSVGKNSMDMAQVTLENASVKGNMADFANTLVEGVLEHQVNLDQYIDKFTKGWGVNRLYVVDRLILEIAMYEMKFTPQTPAKIVIDEALEIAKIYGTDNSKAFINGVLDNFYHKVILEDSPDYKIDENLKQRLIEEEAAQAVKMEEVLAQKVEEAPAPKVEVLPITEEFQGKSFRKIKKETIKEEDKIKPEVEEDEEKRPWNADFIPYITRMTPEENAVFAAEKRKKLDDEKNGVSNPFDDKKSFGDKKPYGDKPKFDGERKSFGDKKPYGDKPKFDGERKSYGDKKPYGDKPKFDGERKSYGDKKPYGDKSKFDGERKSFGDKKPYGDKPKFDGERKSFGDKKPYGDKPKFDGERKSFGDKKPYGDKPKFDGERKSFGDKKPYGDKPKFDGERKSFGDKKPYGDKPKFDGERKSFGDKKPYGDKPKYNGDKKFDKKPYDKPKFDKK